MTFQDTFQIPGLSRTGGHHEHTERDTVAIHNL